MSHCVWLLVFASFACSSAGSFDYDVTLVHNEKSRRSRDSQPNYPSFLNKDFTVFTSNKLPKDRLLPTIGNGHLATVVGSDTIYVNGVYNGRAGDSHRARVPSTAAVSIGNLSTDSYVSTYTLDVGRGYYEEEHIHASGQLSVHRKMYAHQLLNHIIVTQITLTNRKLVPVTFDLTENMGGSSDDINFQADNSMQHVRSFTGNINTPEYANSERVHVHHMASSVPSSVDVLPLSVDRHVFFTAVGTSALKTRYQFLAAVDMFFNDTLESSHVDLWLHKWRNGRIDLHGNTEQSRVTYAALYYVMSSLPTANAGEHFYGLSPGGLAHGAHLKDYQGHIFWDQDTWMFPPILMLHPEMGKAMMEARIGQMKGAKIYASGRHYRGAMFPWETAFTGLDVCPIPIYSQNEIHVNGDIAFALKQYVMMTDDVEFLRNDGGADMAASIAEFWSSRVTLNAQTGKYEINEVMPPDEYHTTVNNSVYTNAVAQISLRLPQYILPMVNRQVPQKYEHIAANLHVPFNVTNQWHPEYDGYVEGTTVKQADVVLLGFPLMMNMPEHVRENDLRMYEKVTPGGPAMTWGMFSIGWLELGQKQKADDLFQKQMLNVNEPFKVWSEVPNGEGAVNFLTGMGGYLQSLIFGYGGFRIHKDRLEFDPQLPPNTTELHIRGLNYLDVILDLSFSGNQTTLTQTAGADNRVQLVLGGLQNSGDVFRMGKTVTFLPQKAYLKKYSKPLPVLDLSGIIVG